MDSTAVENFSPFLIVLCCLSFLRSLQMSGSGADFSKYRDASFILKSNFTLPSFLTLLLTGFALEGFREGMAMAVFPFLG